MTRPLKRGGRFALLLIPIGVLPLIFLGQMARRSTSPSRTIPVRHLTSPQVQDWSNRHAIYSRTGTAQSLDAARRDPRALTSWAEFDRGVAQRRLNSFAARFRIGPRRPVMRTQPIQRDWSIYLGTGGTAETMFPAKFSFDVNATPSCTSDFIVFPVNAVSSATQPNIVAFNQLYSGGTNGLCNRTATGSDNGVAAEVYWSYRVSSIGGAVATSPVLSSDSSSIKVAFVESLAGKPAHFHVLAWKANDGKNTSNLQDVTTPVAPTLVTAAPVGGSGTFTDLALGSATTGSDTLSSPFIDYVNDVAYVGNDAGVLFRIKNVFCSLPSCLGAQPTIDLSFGSSGSVTVCSGKTMTAPILNVVNSKVYVGCSDGKLYAVTTAGVVSGTTVTIGDGSTFGGVVDPPIVDSVNGFVYAVSGSATGAKATLVQAKADFSSNVVVAIGKGAQCDLHSPTPNNAYFNSITGAGAMMYIGGVSGGTVTSCTGGTNSGATVALYGATFNTTTGVIKSPVTDTLALGGGPGYEFAPMTEFFNSTTGNDWLFYSAIQSSQTNVASSEITTGFPTAFTAVTEGIGTSGIIVDNNASSTTFPQAASIYFNALHQNAACSNNTNTALTGGCAVKLTQAGLN
jgi:hypothetical protein